MNQLQASYIGSYPSIEQCPAGDRPEYGFIGRSNVGKSSLINMLCGHKGLAHVSNTPGKTQTLNFFNIEDRWTLVDLPGYGYAMRAKNVKKGWSDMIRGYLAERMNMQCAFLLVDLNVPPQPRDIEFIQWMGEEQVPFVVAYTKADRLSRPKLADSLKLLRETLFAEWETLPQEFITSSEHRTGREEILSFVEGVNKEFNKKR